MRYIDTLKDGDRVSDIYLCKTKTAAMTKTGKEYENLILQDKTGAIEGKIWDPSSAGINEYEALDYVEICGHVTSFNGALQIKIERLRKVSEAEYIPQDYLPASRFDTETMYQELLEIIGRVENPYLRKLLDSFFVNDSEFIAGFKRGSAAKSIHHGFVGGLLEHSLSVAKLAVMISGHYDFLNRDLLVAAAILHDIGKVKEISEFPMNDYTDEGNLLGHIVIGVEMLGQKIAQIEQFPQALANNIKHCILAHHGQLEYGSPKKPAIAEAFALSILDDIDAKLECMRELFEAKDGNDWLGYNRVFESNLKKTMI